LGTERCKGTKTFALTGKIASSGLVEVPMGTGLGEVIFDIGGGILRGRAFKAAQTGGPSGGCLATEHLNLPLDYESLAQAGSIMGSGGLVVLDEDTCMVDVARFFLSFTQQESCGKCTPCRLGTQRMLEILERIVAGEGQREDLDLLAELGETVRLGSLCGLGQTAPNPVLSTLRYFRTEYEAHIVDKHCPAGVCSALMLAPCHNRCPAGQNVPLYVSLLGEGRFAEALEVIRDTNPFPSVCGRVCDHNCEYKCRRGLVDEPIAIRALKRFAVDYERLSGKEWRPSRIEEEKGQKVAIVGGGPAGLTAAYYLARRGYPVTVFEALPVLGGMLAVGIPEYRLPKAILQAEIDGILSLGVEVRLETAVGRDVSLEELQEQYDAVYLATGAHASRPLGLPGEELEGVIPGATFLRDLNLANGEWRNGSLESDDPQSAIRNPQSIRHPQSASRKSQVVVIGAGNVAMDAARSALRLGAAEVQVLYRRTREEAPALGEELEGAEEEGVIFQFLVVPIRFLGNGRVTGVECRRAELGGFDSSGRRRPVEVPGSEFIVPADVVIPAVSQECDLSYVQGENTAALGGRGRTIAVDPRTFATSLPGLFAGGDVTTGPATVIEAIAAGRKAATTIDRYLKGLGVEPRPAEPPQKPAGNPPELEDGEVPRQPQPARPLADRRCNFREVELGYTVEQAVAEARRCLRCDLEA
jgi:NADH-quinone oxidoreductase subunit F